MIYGYARVSTIAQSRDGNSLEEQTAALTEYGCQEIITEAYTGKTVERPRFAELLSRLQSGDTLVITKLDRFARSTIEGVQTVRELFARDVKVHILNIGLIENTLTGNLILTVFLAFAEFERGMILERTQNGRAVARILLFSPSHRCVCMRRLLLRARRMVSRKVSSVQLMGWQGASTICCMEKGAGSW